MLNVEFTDDKYEELFDRFEHNSRFKGLTIAEWSEEIAIGEFSEDFTPDLLETYNAEFVKVLNMVGSNYALAYSNYIAIKRSVEKQMKMYKQAVLDSIEEYNESVTNPANKKRVPMADVLDTQAYNYTLDLQNSLILAEMFYTFWDIHYKRLTAMNQRLTSMSVAKTVGV